MSSKLNQTNEGEYRPISEEGGEDVIAESMSEGVSDEGILLSADSNITPTLSVVMPTLNEEEGVAQCIAWIKNALNEMGIHGEVIVSDDSTDRTPEIARELGAIVVTPDKKGYGYAYQYAFEHARGDFIAMGDADCTYNFEELPKLLRLVQEGPADMAMGSRLEGEILPGSMPKLHQYVGNPLLTKFLNAFYGAGVSDSHSGMRVFSRDALETMELSSPGMEFASEMIMEAGAKDLTIEEVPITYHPRKGEATLESFSDGWRHVKFMLENAPGYLFSIPGLVMGVVGLVMMAISLTNFSLSGVSLGTHSLIAGSLLLIIGNQVVSLGAFASVASNPIQQPTDPVTTFLKRLRLEQSATGGLAIFGIGVAYASYLVWNWASSGFTQLPMFASDILAFTAIVFGLQIVFGSFLLSAIADR
ncbi:glycosyltransferase family 2 protein [Halobium palmae]|uniref:Glycosyltransferase family 2 protein n=1 Tax=Halobium palmae TaxID=1776492 RepID=A0ABD5RVL6_9EURY